MPDDPPPAAHAAVDLDLDDDAIDEIALENALEDCLLDLLEDIESHNPESNECSCSACGPKTSA